MYVIFAYPVPVWPVSVPPPGAGIEALPAVNVVFVTPPAYPEPPPGPTQFAGVSTHP